MSSPACRFTSSPATPLVVHVPHASAEIPPSARSALLPDDAALARELHRVTDHAADRLLAPPDGGTTVRFPVSRLVVDPAWGGHEAATSHGAHHFGRVHLETTDGEPLRATPSREELELMLELHARPHHRRLLTAVHAALHAHGVALVVDGRTFPERPGAWHGAVSHDGPTPDVCLGTDPFHTPPRLLEAAVARFEDAGWTVGIDRPFAGTVVPAGLHRRDARVRSLAISVNRRRCLDEATGEIGPGFESVRAMLEGILRTLTAVAMNAP